MVSSGAPNYLGFFTIKAGDGKLPHGYSVGKKGHCCHEDAENENSWEIEVGYIHHERGISIGIIVSRHLGVFRTKKNLVLLHLLPVLLGNR